MDADVSILIVSHNTRDLTLACLDSLFAQTRGSNFEVIVVDNESADGSADAIEKQFPQARLIRAGRNLGFAAGNNAAAREARGEYLLLLNPDTVLLNDAIGHALQLAKEHNGKAIIGGRTFFADGSLNPGSCHGRPTPWSMFCKGVGLSSLFRQSRWFDSESLGVWPRDCVREVDCITGCFLLIRRSLWEQLGGFDESFFMYGEETDLCLRAQKTGAVCLLCPNAKLIHYGGASETVRADKMVRLFRAKAQLFERHWPRHWVGFGISMLKLWAASRMAALWIVATVRPGRRGGYEAWREVFRRRAEYSLRSGSAGRAGTSDAESIGRAARLGEQVAK